MSVLQQKYLNGQTNIALKKVTGQLTSGMFANYDESVMLRFVSNDQGFFMNQIKETPTYCEKSSGCPTIRLPNLFFNIILF